MPSEAQERYEEAAALAADPAEAARRCTSPRPWPGAGMRATRRLGSFVPRPRRPAGPATPARRPRAHERGRADHQRTGHHVRAAAARRGAGRCWRRRARWRPVMSHVEAAVLTVTRRCDEFDPAYADLAERAVELAHRVGDTRLESHALDQLTAVHLICGELDAGRRHRPTSPRAARAAVPTTSSWRGSTRTPSTWRRWSTSPRATSRPHVATPEQRSELPFFREADHLAVEWLLTTAAIAGDFDEAVSARRPLPARLGRGRPAAARRDRLRPGRRGDGVRHPRRRRRPRRVAPDHRRDAPGRRALARTADHLQPGLRRDGGAASRTRSASALTHVAADPESFKLWHDAAWRPWYAAVWAEAGVLASLPDRRSRLDRARFVVRAEPDRRRRSSSRAEAIDAGDTDATPRPPPPPSTPPGARYQRPAPSCSPVARLAPRARRS